MYEHTGGSGLEIHNKLKDLLKLKSERDGIDFSINKLAKAINMPHSILVKLVHVNPEKRVINPRIETLTKIVDFFKSDGFKITIDDFLFGKNEINIYSMPLNNTETRSIEIFHLSPCFNNIGKIEIPVSSNKNELVAFLSNKDIEPFFKSGSIFIVDTSSKIENNNLIAIRNARSDEIEIKRFLLEDNEKIIMSLSDSKKEKFSTISYHVIGVVVQVNAKT